MSGIVKKVFGLISRRRLLQSEDVTATDMNRCLSTIDVTFLGFGHTIGAGLYVVTGVIVKEKAGPGAILSYLIAACAAFLSGICYSELGTRIPKAGSAYAYSIYVVGELWAFIIGWNMLLENTIGTASVARSLSGYTDSLCNKCIEKTSKQFIDFSDVPYIASYIDVWSGVLILLISSLLFVKVKSSSLMNLTLSCLNIGAILIVIIVGLFYVNIANWKTQGGFLPYGWSGVFSGASIAFYGFIGFENVASSAEETKNPSVTVPRAITSIILTATTAYVSVTTVLTLMIRFDEIDETYPVSQAFYYNGCHWAGYTIAIGAIAAMIATILCSIYAASRLLYSMSQDGLMFQCFGKLTNHSKIPLIGVIISGIFSAIISIFIDLRILVEIFSVGTLMAYSMVNVCVILLRYDSRMMKNISTERSELLRDSTEEVSESLNREVVTVRDSVSCLRTYWPLYKEPSSVIKLCVAEISVSFIVLTLFIKYTPLREWWQLMIVIILAFFIFIGFCCICMYKQTSTSSGFMVPCVPLIPVLSLFVNITLMSFLNHLTLLRLLVWLAIGLILYVTYSVRHSRLKLDSELFERRSGNETSEIMNLPERCFDASSQILK